MSDVDRWRSYVTFTELGGRPVAESEVISELQRLPLDGVLGFLAKVSLIAANPEVDFFDLSVHGEFLDHAIIDDYPTKIPDGDLMNNPGQVRWAKARYLFIHHQNLAWLTHYAILNCRRDEPTEEIGLPLIARCCRLLLIVNDFFADPEIDPTESMATGRSFALTMMRLQQFVEFTANARDAIRALGRQWILFSEYLGQHINVEERFQEATRQSLDEYFEVLALFVPYVFLSMTKEARAWQSRSGLFQNLDACREIADGIISRWITTPDDYIKSHVQFCRDYPLDNEALESFDYVALRDTPIIEARPDELIIPVLPYLYFKPADEPFFLLASDADFRSACGRAYEDYAHSLVERIAQHAADGPWLVWRSPEDRRGNELCDSLLVKDGTAIVFEHKGGRVDSAFLRGSKGDRILGPGGDLLTAVESGYRPSIADLKRGDKALLTHGLWQMGINREKLDSLFEDATESTIDSVWPIITHQAELQVDTLVRRVFLNPLVKKAMPFPDSRWHGPQWIQLASLEALSQVSEEGKLNLLELFEGKESRSVDAAFDRYLSELYGGFPLDPTLDEQGRELMERAARRFWPEKSKERDNLESDDGPSV